MSDRTTAKESRLSRQTAACVVLLALLLAPPLFAVDVVTEGDMEDAGTSNWSHGDILGTNTSDENAVDQVGSGARSLRGQSQGGNRSDREWFASQSIGTIDQNATVSLSFWYGRQHFGNTQGGATIQFWVDVKPTAGSTWSNVWTSGDLGSSLAFQAVTVPTFDVSGSFGVTQAYDLRLRVSGQTGRESSSGAADAYFVGWWDDVVLDVTGGGGNTTTLGDNFGGTFTPTAPTICPGGSADVDAFSFVTDGNSDAVNSVEVTVANAAVLAAIEITTDGGGVLGTVNAPISSPVTIPLSGLTATTGETQYRIRVTAESQANLNPPPDTSYAVTATVTDFTPATNGTAGSDTASDDTVTLDNASPGELSWGTITPGDSQVALNWNNPGGDPVVILRKPSPPPIADAPVEGTDYTGLEGTTIGASTIVYVGTGSSVIDGGVVNNTNYYYRLFVRDACFNYSVGTEDGPHTPAAPNNGTTTQAPSANVDGCDQITASAPFSGDDNGDGSAEIRRGTDGVSFDTVVCPGVTGPSPRVCIDTTVVESSTYHYRVTFTDGDGVTGLNPREIGPFQTPACAADDTSVTDDSAEATSCRQITTVSLFSGDANDDGSVQVEYNTSATWPGMPGCEALTGPSPRQCLIPGLTPGQSYWLRFTYSDPDGVTATAPPNPHQIGPVAVPACGADELAPMVLVLSPARGAVIGGTDRVKVQVFEANLAAVDPVRWSVDSEDPFDLTAAGVSVNGNYDCGTSCAVYEFDLDTTSPLLSNESHYLTIEVQDSEVPPNVARIKWPFVVNNLGSLPGGDGLLLRRTRGSQLCIDCHNLPTHSSQSTSQRYGNWAVDCVTCHTPHRTRNIYLVDETVRTPNSGKRTVRFELTTGAVADSSTAPPSASYVNEDNTTQADGPCQVCHTRTEAPGGGAARWRNSGNADTHFVSSSTARCTDCHTHQAGFSGAGAACNSCHHAPPVIGKHGTHDQVWDSTAGNTATAYSDTDSHATATQYGYACAKCHSGGHFNDAVTNPSHDGSMANPFEVEVEFDTTTEPINSGGNYAGTYNENQDQGPDTRYWSWSDGSCDSLYCHSNASPLGGTPSAATVNWDQAAVLDCTSCHDTQAWSDSGQLVDLSAAHGTHVQSSSGETASYAFRCDECHAQTIVDNPNDPWNLAGADLGNKINHVDGGKDVFFSTTATVADNVDQSGGGYDEGARTCSDLYCHSQGTLTSPPFAAPHDPSLTWDAGSATCESCHGGDAGATNSMAGSNAHGAHMEQQGYLGTNLACGRCHFDTLDSVSDTAITNRAFHVNGNRDVNLFDGGTYGSFSCASAYCHSNGTETLVAADYTDPPDWNAGSPLPNDCSQCHGVEGASIAGEPRYPNNAGSPDTRNSHPQHVLSAGDCGNCHTGTVDGAGALLAGGLHLDGARDVAANASCAGVGDPYTCCTGAGTGNCLIESYDEAAETCANACHGSGNPQWGGGALTCLSCHSGVEAGNVLGDGAPNAVDDNWTTPNGNPANNVGHGGLPAGTGDSGPLTSAFDGCDYCHDLGASHTPTDPTNPYRLRFSATDNLLCLQCHSTGDGGISANSEGTGLTLRDGNLDVDTAHYGAKHEDNLPTDREGGFLCWDCHDPHGVADNILMAKSLVSASSDTYGVPLVTATVNFTDNTATGQAVGNFTEDTNTPRTGICQACHDPAGQGASGPTNYWHSDGSQGTHNADLLCTNCHEHNNNFTGAGTCLDCHNTAQGSGATARRAVVGGGADNNDFDKGSHHVGADNFDPDGAGGDPAFSQPGMGGALTSFDCIVCHAEGYVEWNAGPAQWEVRTNATYHGNDGGTTSIDLRDVDNRAMDDGGATGNVFSYDKEASGMPTKGIPGQWNSANAVWRAQTSGYSGPDGSLTAVPGTGLDPFCLTCHDSDGALTANTGFSGGQGVALDDPHGTAGASNPFGDLAITNEYDRLVRGSGVIDVASRVVAGGSSLDAPGEPRYDETPVGDGIPDPPQGIYARHAIRGQSLSVYSSATGGNGDIRPVYWNQTTVSWEDDSVMGCADCHTTDGANDTTGNAHGSNSEYLLKNIDGLAIEGTLDGSVPFDGSPTNPETSGTYNCYLCHSRSQFAPNTDHTGNDQDYQDYTQESGTARIPVSNTGGNLFGMACTNCHGGAYSTNNPAGETPEFGTIHGTSQTLQVGPFDRKTGLPAGTRRAYRFMNGNSMRFYQPDDDDTPPWNWSGSSITCYTIGSGDSFGGCTKHEGSAGTHTKAADRVRDLKY